MFPPLTKVTVPFFHTKLNGLTPLAVVLNVAVVPLQLVELLNGVAVVPASTVSVAGEITVPQAPVTSTLYCPLSPLFAFVIYKVLMLLPVRMPTRPPRSPLLSTLAPFFHTKVNGPGPATTIVVKEAVVAVQLV
jgi:hypothetical protein